VRYDILSGRPGVKGTVLSDSLAAIYPGLSTIAALEEVAGCNWKELAENPILVNMAYRCAVDKDKYFSIGWLSDRCRDVLGSGFYSVTVELLRSSRIFNEGAGRFWFKHPKFADIIIAHSFVREILEQGVTASGVDRLMVAPFVERLDVLFDVCKRENIVDDVFGHLESKNVEVCEVGLERVRLEYSYSVALLELTRGERLADRSAIKKSLIELLLLLILHGTLDDYVRISNGLCAIAGSEDDDWLKTLVLVDEVFDGLLFNPVFTLSTRKGSILAAESDKESERLIGEVVDNLNQFWSRLELVGGEVESLLRRLESNPMTDLSCLPPAIIRRCIDGELNIDFGVLVWAAKRSDSVAHILLYNREYRIQLFRSERWVEFGPVFRAFVHWALRCLDAEEFHADFTEVVTGSPHFKAKQFEALMHRFGSVQLANAVLKRVNEIRIEPVRLLRCCRNFWTNADLEVFANAGKEFSKLVGKLREIEGVLSESNVVLNAEDWYKVKRLGLGDLVIDSGQSPLEYVIVDYVGEDVFGQEFYPITGIKYSWLNGVSMEPVSIRVRVSDKPRPGAVLVQYGAGLWLESDADVVSELKGRVVGSSKSPRDKWVRVYGNNGATERPFWEFYFFDADLDFFFDDIVAFQPALNNSTSHRMRLMATEVKRMTASDLMVSSYSGDLLAGKKIGSSEEKILVVSRGPMELHSGSVYPGYSLGEISVPRWYCGNGRCELFLVDGDLGYGAGSRSIEIGGVVKGIAFRVGTRFGAFGVVKSHEFLDQNEADWGVEPGRIMVNYYVGFPLFVALRYSRGWWAANRCLLRNSDLSGRVERQHDSSSS
jgi:hypothetical protein